MKLVGEAVYDQRSANPEKELVALGIASWGFVANHDKLKPVRLSRLSCLQVYRRDENLQSATLCSRMHVEYVHYHHHLSLNREGRWGTVDDFTTSFLHFSLFSTALWDLANSRPVHSLMLCSHLFLCLHCLLPPFTVPCKMALARPDERET